jgi:hypothetical protein
MGRPLGSKNRKDPEAIPDVPRKRAAKVEEDVTDAPDFTAGAEFFGPAEDSPNATKRTYKKRKKKETGTRPVSPRLIAAAADGALDIAATGYHYFRKPRKLEYDGAQKEEFCTLLGQWAEEEGMELPLWVQVAIAGGICVGSAVVRAEAGGIPPAVRSVRSVSVFDTAQVPPTSPLRPTPVDSDRGNEGEREDVVPETLAPEPRASGVGA